MTGIIFLIESVANGLYLFGAVGLIIFARQLMKSRQRLRYAEFALERELAYKDQAGAVTWLLGLLEIMLAVVAVSYVIAPTLRNDLAGGSEFAPAQATPTNIPFYTSTPGGSGGGGGTPGAGGMADFMLTVTARSANDNSGPKPIVTLTPSPTLVGTINPDVPAAQGCESSSAQLDVPANGQVIFDSLEVRGTANVPNFTLYRFEISGPSTGNSFAPFGGDKTSPAPQKGILGQLALSAFQPGFYKFRLAVFDNTNLLKASCTVTVELRQRPPTATPLGASEPTKAP